MYIPHEIKCQGCGRVGVYQDRMRKDEWSSACERHTIVWSCAKCDKDWRKTCGVDMKYYRWATRLKRLKYVTNTAK